jgi:3,4-dihydroxy 2-butanone 4-phosphate synthase/GTP cyclohydrolase II
MSPVPELLEELRAGRMIVLVDDEDRENEGDVVFAAEHATPETANFLLLHHARGELCIAMDAATCERLDLRLEPTSRPTASAPRSPSRSKRPAA